MGKKQTAVEWLFEQVWLTPISELPKILKQAKEMEKEQIIDAHNQGYADGYRDNCKSPIEYYEQTYGGKDE